MSNHLQLAGIVGVCLAVAVAAVAALVSAWLFGGSLHRRPVKKAAVDRIKPGGGGAGQGDGR